MTSEQPEDAQSAYRSRLEARRAERATTQGSAELWGNVRLGLTLTAITFVLLPLYTRSAWSWWALLPLAIVFALLGRRIDGLHAERDRLDAAIRFFEEGLCRIEEKWRSLPSDGRRFVEGLSPLHYAHDLDLFGPASLFQLLNRGVTRAGERRLADWLLEPAPLDEVTARQTAVAELVPALDFREQLARSASRQSDATLDGARLLDWARGGAPLPMPRLLRAVGILLPLVLFSTLGLFIVTGSRGPLILAALVQIVAVFGLRSLTEPRAHVLSGPERLLSRYVELLETVERPDFKSERITRVQASLKAHGGASEKVHALTRLVDLLDARLNMFFALSFGPALMWDLNLVLSSEKWRQEIGPHLEGWFEAIADLEALSSLAAIAHERPDYCVPHFVEGTTFTSKGLLHPLIDRRGAVANDLVLDGRGFVLLLSGSNMSGKSTLLRSVGINQILARAGSVVGAQELALSDLELATSVRIVDSLAAGTSHFYAELERLKHIVDRGKDASGRLLYLLDEMLHGTNSRERMIGAIAVIRWLSESGAIGIVTTHDLALAKVADQLPSGRAINKHFSDDLVDGVMRFDYSLREGPVASTNALRLMKHVGIDVEFHGIED